MAAEASNPRKDRLAAALRENLKRRKAQARVKADMSPKAKGLGTAPQAGLEDRPDAGPKSAPKRN
jgi:hypothetical protein